MPGVDPRDAATTVVGELPDLPHVVELPGRGAGADMVGRAAALLVDLHVDLQPSGWRLVPRAGHDEQRAASYLSRDLDAIEEAADGYEAALKLQVCGPWTLAAALQLPRGEPVLSDSGALRDVADSLAEAVAAHVADVRRRIPRAQVVVQLDEPSLPLVLAGGIRSVSGLHALEPVPDHGAEAVLRTIATAAAAPVVAHCCAHPPPVALLHRSGAAAISVDCTLLDGGQAGQQLDQEIGEALEAGVVLFAGVAASSSAQLSDVAGTVEPVRALWRRLGLGPELLASRVVVTPTCGLAGAAPHEARAALERCRKAAAFLVENPEAQ